MSSSDGNGNHVSIDDGDASDEDNYPKQRPILNRHFFNKLFPKKNASRENPVDYKSVDGELSDDDCNNGDEHHSSPESPTTSIDEVPNEDQDNEYDNVTLDHSVGKCLEHDSEDEEIHDSRISLLNTRYDGLEEGEGDEEYFDSDASKGLNLSKDSKEYEDSRISKTDFGAQDVTEANENEDNMNLDDENEDNMNLDDGDDNPFLNVVGGTSTHVINQHDTSHHLQTAPQVTMQHVPSTRYGATQTQPVQSEVNGHISQEDIGTTDHDDMDYRDEGQTDNDDPLMPNKGRTIEAETLSSPLQQDVDYLPGEFLIQELEKGAPTERLGWEVVGKDKTATRFYPLQVLDNTRQAEWDLRSNWANVKFNREINCEALLRYTLPQIHDSFMTFGLQWLLGGNKPFSWEYVRDFYRHMRVPETFPADDPWFYTEIEGTPVYVDKYTISSCTDMPLDHTVDLIDSLNEEVMTMIASELFEQPCYVSNQGIPVSKLGYRMKLIFKIAQRNVCGVRQSSYINGPALYWAYKFLKTESLNVPMYILKHMMSRNFSPKESPYPCLIHQILVMKGFRDFGSNSTCVAEDYGLTTVWKQKHFKSHYVGNIKRVVDERCQMLEILPPTIPSIARRVLADAGEYQKLGDTEKAFVVQKPATRDGIGLHETIEGTSSTSSITLQVALADMQTALIAHMTGIEDAILHQVTTTQKELTKRLDKLEDQVTNLQMLVDPPCDEDDQSEEQKADRVQEVLRPAKRHRIDTTVTSVGHGCGAPSSRGGAGAAL